MANYNFNPFDYVKKALPPFIRGAKLLAYLRALLAPLTSLGTLFNEHVSASRYLANFTGQEVYLEHLLNDNFDPVQRRIYIDDGVPAILPPFVFNKIEQRPVYVYNKAENKPLYIFNKTEYGVGNDFIVFVPNSILNTLTQTQIEATVLIYKLASKQFSIQGF
jgi:hypothetical protein